MTQAHAPPQKMPTQSSPKPNPDLLDRLDGILARTEALLVVVILFMMISICSVQFASRKLFDFGFEWADTVVRHMVLWLGFVGGALATQKGRHISIDAVCHLVSAQRAAQIRALTSCFAVLVSVVLTYASVQFVRQEYADNTKLFADLPAWPFQIVMPCAFLAISIHFLAQSRNQVRRFRTHKSNENPVPT